MHYQRQGYTIDFEKPMVPRVMMVATRPMQQIPILFQTHKVLANLPEFMLEPLMKPVDIHGNPIEDSPMAQDNRMNNFLSMSA